MYILIFNLLLPMIQGWSFFSLVQTNNLVWQLLVLAFPLLAIITIVQNIFYRQKQLIQQLQAERQQLQNQNAELAKENQNLRHLSHLKDEFLINTTHELRTPLNGMSGIIESLLDGVAGELAPQQAKNLMLVMESSYRLADLVNDILDFSQMQLHCLEIQLQPVAVKEITDVVVTVSQMLIASKQVELINLIPIDLPPVKADPNRLQQILYNLIGNAIKFTSKGKIEITATLIQGSNNPSLTQDSAQTSLANFPILPFMAITVRDTGIGIPEDQYDRVFQSFMQLENTSNSANSVNLSNNLLNNLPKISPTQGYGLGLSIAKNLVEIHGGSIWLESIVDQGSAFTFTLPIAPGEKITSPSLQTSIKTLLRRQIILDDQSPISIAEEPALSLQPANRQYQVLVVDDDRVNLQVISNYLKRYNYTIAQALNGKEALEIINSGFTPDLILLDVVMPEMSGYELCQKIREKFPPDELPIIMLTGRRQVSNLVEGLNLGANDYLTKPISKNELLARITTQLHLSQLNLAYSRFVPRQFLRLLKKDSILDVQLGDQVQKEMSILFADIRDFTTLSEKMSLPENFKFINSYLSRMEPEIVANHGFIDKYIGDALMALFSGSARGSADDAVRAGINMLETLKEYNQHRGNSGYAPIKIGIGINTGSLMLGTVGGKNRMDSTVISDAVNLASRLEGLTKEYTVPLLISHHTFWELEDANKYCIRLIDRVQVKGKSEWVTVNEVFDADLPEIREGKLATLTIFMEAWLLYNQTKFKEAAEVFGECLRLNPGDQVAQVYLGRCERSIRIAALKANLLL